MESVEDATCERPDLTSKLRDAITGRQRGEWRGAARATPVVVDFLLAVAEEVEASGSFAKRLAHCSAEERAWLRAKEWERMTERPAALPS